MFWIMGGFFRANWSVVLNLLIGVLPCLLLLHLLAWKINILSLGDEEAGSLGINVKVFRFLLLCLATFMVAGCVSVSGTIGWVGLVVPHIARLLTGADHRYVLPMSMLVGAGFVMLMDNLARGLTSAEIPISILTAAVGTPFLLIYLLRDGDRPGNEEIFMSLAVENVTFSYGERRVVDQCSFSLPRGQVVCLLGRNGSGKTTLLRLANRSLQPKEGRITIDGTDIRSFTRKHLARLIAFCTPGAQCGIRLYSS